MGFSGVCRAIYDYSPQGEGELELKENDLLLVIDNSSDDGWWKAKKKAASDSDDEPEGLIANNYVVPAQPLYKVRGLYEYTRQTDEELSFTEETILDVYDSSDNDWILAGIKGDFGFVPSNYVDQIDHTDESPVVEAKPEATPPPMPTRPSIPEPQSPELKPPSTTRHLEVTPESKAATTSNLEIRPIEHSPQSQSRSVRFATTNDQIKSSPPTRDRERGDHSSLNDHSSPTLTPTSPPDKRRSFFNKWSTTHVDITDKAVSVPDAVGSNYTSKGFKLYTIYQYKKATGKDIKVPFLLGINVPEGLVMTSDLSHHNAKEQIWEGTRMSNYSIEGKVLFLDLVKPSESYHLHCGNTETAREIMLRLGEIAGASRLGGMQEVIAAAHGPRKLTMGRVRIDPTPTEVGGITLQAGEVVVVLDANPEEDWWRVQKVAGDDGGLVQRHLIELLSQSEIRVVEKQIKDGTFGVGRSSPSNTRQGRQSTRQVRDSSSPSKSLPQRASSLYSKGNDSLAPERTGSLRHSASNRDTRQQAGSGSKKEREKPDPAKVRVWTDRSSTFKVEAQFLGVRDGKIHLHKMNGVQIAVPVSKMSVEDIEFVEKKMGISLDEDKPLSEIRRKATALDSNRNSTIDRTGISIQSSPNQYDWFSFFLACGVNPHICERYSSAFKQDQMREDQMSDINGTLLKTLGVKEGDVLRIMKYLDTKFARLPAGESSSGGLFSGPGGTLHNNTAKKTRPSAPDGLDYNKIDSDGLKPKNETIKQEDTVKTADQKVAVATTSTDVDLLGFDDDAWAPRPVHASSPSNGVSKDMQESAHRPADQSATAALSELPTLVPIKLMKPDQSITAIPPQNQPLSILAQAQVPQITGATPDLFKQISQLSIQNDSQGRQRPSAPPPSSTNPGSMIPPLPVAHSLGPASHLQPNITGVVPYGSSLAEIGQQRMASALASSSQGQSQMMHPQMMPMQPQMTGFTQMMPAGMMMPTMTGHQQPMNMGMPQLAMGNSFLVNQTPSPFADPTPFQAQMTGFQPQHTGFQPQQTGFQTMGYQATGAPGSFPSHMSQPIMMLPQQTGMMAFGTPGLMPQHTGTLPLNPSMPPLSAFQPLKAEKPPPNIKFGIGSSKTGRAKANISHATPDNPFGF